MQRIALPSHIFTFTLCLSLTTYTSLLLFVDTRCGYGFSLHTTMFTKRPANQLYPGKRPPKCCHALTSAPHNPSVIARDTQPYAVYPSSTFLNKATGVALLALLRFLPLFLNTILVPKQKHQVFPSTWPTRIGPSCFARIFSPTNCSLPPSCISTVVYTHHFVILSPKQQKPRIFKHTSPAYIPGQFVPSSHIAPAFQNHQSVRNGHIGHPDYQIVAALM